MQIGQEATSCPSEDIALKGFFLGPQSENAKWFGEAVAEVLESWFRWRKSLYPQDGNAITETDQRSCEFARRRSELEAVLRELVGRFEEEVPKFSPRYIGHMFSETSLPALLGHLVTLLHNPNNISGECSRVGVQLEKEAIQELGAMVGYPKRSVGHFTSGGTIANFEALVRARHRMAIWLAAGAASRATRGSQISLLEAAHLGWEALDRLGQGRSDWEEVLRKWNLFSGNPWERSRVYGHLFGQEFRGPVLLVPAHAHYSWKKGASLLGLGDEAVWTVELDARGVLCVESLRARLEQARLEFRPVLMVVSVAGSTEHGAVDPVHEVASCLADWRAKTGFHIWHHVDAAYGGFFCSLLGAGELSDSLERALSDIVAAESVTLDPHKLGYVPYSAGAFLVADARNYAVPTPDSPYLDFKVDQDKGPLTIEGSRSAAGAAATWMTARSIGFDSNGFGRILGRTIRTRITLEELLTQAHPFIRVAPDAATNISCFCVAEDGELLSRSNQKALAVYSRFSGRTGGEFQVSKTTLRWPSYGKYLDRFIDSWNGRRDCDELVLIRLCLMNPFLSSRETRMRYLDRFVSSLASELSGQ